MATKHVKRPSTARGVSDASNAPARSSHSLDALPADILSSIAMFLAESVVAGRLGDVDAGGPGRNGLAFLSKKWSNAAIPVFNSFFVARTRASIVKLLPLVHADATRRAQLRCVDIHLDELDTAMSRDIMLTGQMFATLGICLPLFPHLQELSMHLAACAGLDSYDAADVVEFVPKCSQLRRLYLDLECAGEAGDTWTRVVRALNSSTSAQNLRHLDINLPGLTHDTPAQPIEEDIRLPALTHLVLAGVDSRLLSSRWFPVLSDLQLYASTSDAQAAGLCAFVEGCLPMLEGFSLHHYVRDEHNETATRLRELLGARLSGYPWLKRLRLAGNLLDGQVVAAIPAHIEELASWSRVGDALAPIHTLMLRLATDFNEVRKIDLSHDSLARSREGIEAFCAARNIVCILNADRA